ncbi:MAG: hypothetical protein AB7F91_03310 [Parvularculaceae bacterium]
MGDVVKNQGLKKLLLSAAALGVVATLPGTAAAASGRHGGHHYRPHHYSHSYRPHYSHYRYYDYRHHRRSHISGGEAALIAAGIIGGVILIDRALDNRDRYDDRYYDRRYDDRYRRGAFADDDYYYQRDSRDYDGRGYDDRNTDWRYDGRDFDDRDYRTAEADGELDDRLLGSDDRAARPLVLADAAFRECVAETRGAAGAGGMNVAMPGAPTEVEQLADGSVRMTAQFRASNARGESWTRRFVCEADGQGVRFLQVD